MTFMFTQYELLGKNKFIWLLLLICGLQSLWSWVPLNKKYIKGLFLKFSFFIYNQIWLIFKKKPMITIWLHYITNWKKKFQSTFLCIVKGDAHVTKMNQHHPFQKNCSHFSQHFHGWFNIFWLWGESMVMYTIYDICHKTL
jgi:hypothetical protein